MTVYTSMKIKPNQLPHYNNLMYNNVVFKLERVDAKNLFNNPKNEAIFHANIEKLNGTDRGTMLQELTTLHRLLASYATVNPSFDVVKFANDANYTISLDMVGNIPMYSFTTKNTKIKVVSVVDILNKFDSTKYVADRVKESLLALEGFKKLGKIPDRKKK